MVIDDAFTRGLIDAVPDAVIVTDTEGRIVFVNASCEAMFRYAHAELVSQPIEVLVPEHRRAAHHVAREGFAHEPVARPMGTGMVLAGRRKDGTELPIDVSLGTARTTSGVFFMAVVRDTSARKEVEAALRRSEQRAEEVLRRSEERLARAQRVAHVGSFEWDLRTNAVERSAELCALFGLGPETATGPPWSLSEMLHPEDREEVLRVLADAEREGRSYRVEHRIIRRDGAERVVLQQGDVVMEGERVARIVGTMLDITERRRVENEREELLQELQAVLDECPVGIVLARGEHGEHLRLNESAKIIVGRPIDHVGQYPSILLAPDERPIGAGEHPTLRALRGERVASEEFLLRQANGATMPVMMSAAPMPATRGGVPRAVVTMQDMSAAKQLERLRAEWGSIVAHDLRQPLNGIALNASMVARALAHAPSGPIPAALKATETIIRLAVRLNRMIEDLLDLSQLEAHRLVLSRSPTDLVALVRTVLEPLEMGEKTSPFDVRVDGAIPLVTIDPDRIAQVMENLLSNAMKYGAAGRPIVVEIGVIADRVSVAVTNEGSGIPPEDLPRLFDRFTRAEEVRRGAARGVGLGLYIAHELVAGHGGEVTAESVLGGLTTFRFTIPILVSGLHRLTA